MVKSWRELLIERYEALCDLHPGKFPSSINREPVSWWKNAARQDVDDEATPPPVNADIVERLRLFSGPPQSAGYANILAAEAADEIERLRHENMRLETANEYAFGPTGEIANLNREIERLRKEREKQ